MGDCQSLGDCDDKRIARIYEYLDGALSCEDLEEIRTHLADCSDCSEEYDLECVIRTVVKRSCKEAAPETLKAAILARVPEGKSAQV